MNRRLSLAVTVSLLSLAGCGSQQQLLGTEGQYLFTSYDLLAIPSQPVKLQARIQGGDLLRGRGGHTIRFYRNDVLIAAAVTNNEGFAEVSFTPSEPDDYIFRVDLAPGGFEGSPPPAIPLRLTCRNADAPIVIVDLDKTLVASGFEEVLVGDPLPMENSPRVMKRIAKDYTVVYLTHRPDLFGPKSKAWLKKYDYPPGPVLMSDFGGFLRGSSAFKTDALARICKQFRGIRYGIGDKPSDASAYHANKIAPIVIVQPQHISGREDLLELANDIQKSVPADANIVSDWGQIEQLMYNGASFPPQTMIRTLQDLAARKSPAAPATATSSSSP